MDACRRCSGKKNQKDLTMMHIPLNKPYWGRKEEQAVLSAMRRGTGVADGVWGAKLRTKLRALTGAKFAFPVTNATNGLEMAVACLTTPSKSEVIVPSFTLSATALAFVNRGAIPIFADIDRETYCLDPDDVAQKITKRTVGIMVVHYAGMAYKLESLVALAKKYHLWLIEDAAHAIGATYHGKALGTFGDAGVFSFHGTKNIACGEGGAVVTNDKLLADRMDIYRAIGTNRQAFLAGKVSLYEWVGLGSSFLLSDILAAVAFTQLGRLPDIAKRRSKIAFAYMKAFRSYSNIMQLPVVPEGVRPNWHIFAVRFAKPDYCKEFIRLMRAKGIEVSTHFMPLHTSPMGRNITPRYVRLPVTEEVARTLVRLPIYPGLTGKELGYIVRSAKEILKWLQKA
jgi:dTDP-4-amino-4,6-dideoxygalactose transaminase